MDQSIQEREKEGKKEEKGGGPEPTGPPLPPSEDKGKEKETGKSGMKREGIPKRRVPKAAAVCIRGNSDNFSYAEALRKARTSISLADLQIGSPKIRKGGKLTERQLSKYPVLITTKRRIDW